MPLLQVLAELDQAIAQSAPEDRPALALALTARLGALAAGMALNGNPAPEQTRDREEWITPAQAAAIAAIPVKRLYEWARGKRWANRPTRRTLRVNEAAFRAWLAQK